LIYSTSINQEESSLLKRRTGRCAGSSMVKCQAIVRERKWQNKRLLKTKCRQLTMLWEVWGVFQFLKSRKSEVIN
jgi:hypothetical protein